MAMAVATLRLALASRSLQLVNARRLTLHCLSTTSRGYFYNSGGCQTNILNIEVSPQLELGLLKEWQRSFAKAKKSTFNEVVLMKVLFCSNPDQSKHLETARMRILDVWIDFVNLRSETYAEHSRIPTMEFGTAEQDAYRRDLTINSLFYNINTGSVEDLTGRGISDLKAGIIATPLPPKSTFLDDPLRVLRAIRFGARFEFRLDDELKKAAADEEVKAALASKISRERIGHETVHQKFESYMGDSW